MKCVHLEWVPFLVTPTKYFAVLGATQLHLLLGSNKARGAFLVPIVQDNHRRQQASVVRCVAFDMDAIVQQAELGSAKFFETRCENF